MELYLVLRLVVGQYSGQEGGELGHPFVHAVHPEQRTSIKHQSSKLHNHQEKRTINQPIKYRLTTQGKAEKVLKRKVTKVMAKK